MSVEKSREQAFEHQISINVAKALSDETRLMILSILLAYRAGLSGEEILSKLASEKGKKIGQTALSQHLGVLKRAGLVQAPRTGKSKTNTIQTDVLLGLMKAISTLI